MFAGIEVLSGAYGPDCFDDLIVAGPKERKDDSTITNHAFRIDHHNGAPGPEERIHPVSAHYAPVCV